MFKRPGGFFETKKKKIESQNAELKKLKSETKFEKSDFFALVIAAATTILPVVAVLIFLFYLFIKWMFG